MSAGPCSWQPLTLRVAWRVQWVRHKQDGAAYLIEGTAATAARGMTGPGGMRQGLHTSTSTLSDPLVYCVPHVTRHWIVSCFGILTYYLSGHQKLLLCRRDSLPAAGSGWHSFVQPTDSKGAVWRAAASVWAPP